ncbi:MAG TPA: Hsp20 family protein [Thermoanaerobaculia bacterium]|nr:Hsp20 family protein [Thermoanaerobaculia bacterium]
MPAKPPFSVYDELGNKVKKMWLFSSLEGDLVQKPASAPQVDVYREADHLVVKAVLPGVRREDIQLTLEEGELRLQWELREEPGRSPGSSSKQTAFLYRRLPLDFKADPEKIVANLISGVLEVRIPFPAQGKPSPLDAGRLLAELQARIGGRLAALASFEMAGIRQLVGIFDECLATVNEIAGLSGEIGTLVRHTALQACFPALRLFHRGDSESALRFLLLEWTRASAALGLPRSMTELSEEPETALSNLPPEAEHELLSAFNTAVSALLRETQGQSRGRGAVRHLMTHLDLSFDQAGRALGVSGETVRRWERGSHEIPAERMADLLRAEAALDRLLGVFRAERLAFVVRRQAELFSGESALDWIFRGRIGEVADRYETALSYQA